MSELEMANPRGAVYPFTAIVGQDRMRLALELNAVNPAIGGVLIRGEKGRPSQPRCVRWRACSRI